MNINMGATVVTPVGPHNCNDADGPRTVGVATVVVGIDLLVFDTALPCQKLRNVS